MTSCLQPVDAAIGSSFKCAFQRLLVAHILKYVDQQMEIAPAQRAPFKINKAVSTYDAVCMMASAWNMVLTSVVINGWLSCGVLVPFQEVELKQIKLDCRKEIVPAQMPQLSSSLSCERAVCRNRSIIAKQRGEEWIRQTGGAVHGPLLEDDNDCNDNGWNEDNVALIREDYRRLADLEVVDDFTNADIDGLFETERAMPACHPVSSENAVQSAVRDILGGAEEKSRLIVRFLTVEERKRCNVCHKRLH